MTEKLICPNCERYSYTTAPCEPTPCPYCGFVFSEADKGVKKMRRRILVIDDDSTIRDILAAILIKQGYEIDIAKNGVEGLMLLYDKRYDLIISDINMPIMDGIKFYRKLIERMPSMRQRVLFITGNKDRETDMFLKEMGLRHLLKPFTTSGLLDALNEADAFRSNV